MIRFKLISLIIFVMILTGCSKRYHMSGAITDSPWKYHRGDLSSTGAVSSDGFNGKLDIIWESSSNDKPAGPLSITNGHLVYPGAGNKIKFFDLNNGAFKGYIRTKGNPQTGMMIHDSLGYYATAPFRNKLYCKKMRDQGTVWRTKVKDVVSGTIILNNRLIVASGDGIIMGLNLLTGEADWTFESTSRFTAPPSVLNGNIVQPGNDGTLYIISGTDGSLLTKVALDGPVVGAVAADKNLFCGDVLGNAYCVDAEKGKIIWRRNLGSPIWTAPAITENLVIFGTSGGDLVALEAGDGHTMWTYEAVEVIKASPIVCGGIVVTGTMGGKLFSLTTADGELVEEREVKGAIAVSPVSDGRRVYIATQEGRIISFGQHTQAFGKADQ